MQEKRRKEENALEVEKLRIMQLEKEIENVVNLEFSLNIDMERLKNALAGGNLQKLKIIEKKQQTLIDKEKQENPKLIQEKLTQIRESNDIKINRIRLELEEEKQRNSIISSEKDMALRKAMMKLSELETQSSIHVQEIVRNVLEINHLKEELENEKKINDSKGYSHLSAYSPYKSKYPPKKLS